MPEELAIALIILVIAVWLLVKILQGLARFIGEIQKESSQAILQGRKNRYISKKASLARHVRIALPDQLDSTQHQLDLAEAQLKQLQATKWDPQRPTWTRAEFKPYSPPVMNETYEEMDAEDIASILAPSVTTWSELESELINKQCAYPFHPPSNRVREFTPFPSLIFELDNATFESDRFAVSEKQVTRYLGEELRAVSDYNSRRSHLIARRDALNQEISEWNQRSRSEWEKYATQSGLFAKEEASAFALASNRYIAECEKQKNSFRLALEGYTRRVKKDVIARTGCVLGNLSLPLSVPRIWDIDFDEEQGILLIEVGLPDVVHRPPFKRVLLKNGPVKKPLNQTERKEIIPRVHPAILLKVAFEVFRSDVEQIIKLLVLNGWVRFDDPRTGINTKAYTSSLMVEASQLIDLNLSKIDPLAAFDGLHGKSAGKLVEIVPIEPTLSLNRKDSRFVDAKAVLNTLGTATNLAAMDWQDFEHLIRELFEKEFAGRGAEVKITQASRDRGVDAIVFDPDPIHGGKYVIQAKRYTNTVDVSSVRDLCAVVKKEGASKGILVTTSTYGADAYSFANNEPVTLLNGAELLGLLRRHGYGFRINLQEARRLFHESLPKGSAGNA